jgi:hypothetical protein
MRWDYWTGDENGYNTADEALEAWKKYIENKSE